MKTKKERKTKKTENERNSKKRKITKRNKKTLRKGGACCVCDKRAHKICSDCWWDDFANETASHKCPGCVKGIPVKSDPDKGKVIDLTTSD
jgi:hypothetical protein